MCAAAFFLIVPLWAQTTQPATSLGHSGPGEDEAKRTCPPGSGVYYPGEPACPGYRPGFNASQCLAVGCCVDAKLYPGRQVGWCFVTETPIPQPPPWPPSKDCSLGLVGEWVVNTGGAENTLGPFAGRCTTRIMDNDPTERAACTLNITAASAGLYTVESAGHLFTAGSVWARTDDGLGTNAAVFTAKYKRNICAPGHILGPWSDNLPHSGCRLYTANMTDVQCEAVGCCVNKYGYAAKSGGWCFEPPHPEGVDGEQLEWELRGSFDGSCSVLYLGHNAGELFHGSPMQFCRADNPACLQRPFNGSNSFWSSGEIHILETTHSDILWLGQQDDMIIDATEVGLALDLMRNDSTFKWAHEDMLILRSFVKAFPEREGELRQRLAEGRLDFGATFTEPFEELLYNEVLARQMYSGRKWFVETFPEAKTGGKTIFNNDNPSKAWQWAQVYAKAGVRYAKLARFGDGIFRWGSPDGSSLLVYEEFMYNEAETGTGKLPPSQVDACMQCRPMTAVRCA
jgi:hypothetical protein